MLFYVAKVTLPKSRFHIKLKGEPSILFLPKSCKISTGVIFLCGYSLSKPFSFFTILLYLFSCFISFPY